MSAAKRVVRSKPTERRVTKREQQRQAQAAAMPEVKALVRLYGRSAIAVCLSKLKEYEKSRSRLAALKEEVALLEKKL